MEVKKCCFIGHRKVSITCQLEKRLREVIEEFIIKNNVSIFLFGSRSECNNFCHKIVSELRGKYNHIKRIAYTCKSETCILECELLKMEKLYSKYCKTEVKLYGVEEEFEYSAKYKSGKASYVERNQAMIDNSDYCVFYYETNYQPEQNSRTVNSSHKSGTRLAYNYAKRKNKQIINLADIS